MWMGFTCTCFEPTGNDRPTFHDYAKHFQYFNLHSQALARGSSGAVLRRQCYRKRCLRSGLFRWVAKLRRGCVYILQRRWVVKSYCVWKGAVEWGRSRCASHPESVHIVRIRVHSRVLRNMQGCKLRSDCKSQTE